MHCQSCGADLPDDARFCIECGADVGPAASTGATVQLPRQAAATAIACRSCGAANPDYAVYCVRCGRPVAEPAHVPGGTPQSLAPSGSGWAPGQGRSGPSGVWGGVVGAIFMIGLAALFLLKLPFWPGILIVAGVVAFVSEAARGRYFKGLSSVIWLFGLAFLFMVPRLWWPGMFAIIGLNILIDMLRRSLRQP